MSVTIDIAKTILPVFLAGGIGIFVVLRMQHKYKNGTLGRKKTKNQQNLLNSLIPLGMMIGCAVGVLISLYFPTAFLSATSIGAAIGLLFGYFSYEIYSRSEDSY